MTILRFQAACNKQARDAISLKTADVLARGTVVSAGPWTRLSWVTGLTDYVRLTDHASFLDIGRRRSKSLRPSEPRLKVSECSLRWSDRPLGRRRSAQHPRHLPRGR